MTVVENIRHIVRDEQGTAWIDQANVKVIEIVLDHLAYGWSADEIHEHLPHLSLAQIHAALAFYYDHQPEFNAQIQRDLQVVDHLRTSTGESAMQRRLRTLIQAA